MDDGHGASLLLMHDLDYWIREVLGAGRRIKGAGGGVSEGSREIYGER